MTAALSNQVPAPLARPVTTLWGVGSERAMQLAKLEIRTIEDLLLHRPSRYEDRRRFRSIADLRLGELMLTRGTVVALGVKRYRKGTKSVFELILDDGTARLHCRWWNLPFMEKYFQTGDEVVVFGKPLSLKPRTMDHPETEVVESGEERFIHFNRITPIYPLTEGLPQRWLRGLIWRALQKYVPGIRCQVPGVRCQGSGARDQVPGAKSEVRDERIPDTSHLTPDTSSAIHMLHFPETIEDIEIARRRLALDEFIELQRQIRLRRKKFEASASALPCGGDNRLIKPFLAALGFKLTDAQTKVLREIRADLRGSHPMRRLLQGDVGSGKTVVAACSALMAIESGYTVALMAPTEILAGQHFANFAKWFGSLGIVVELRTGSRKTVNGPQPIAPSQPGKRVTHATHGPGPSLIIGTHALLEEAVSIENLGLVIIDEQHKFGVAQREQLVRKGRYPHLLVMTATPIPRTLGLTLYGELDVSTIDSPPPGRGRIKTFVRTADTLSKVWAFVRNQLSAGRQAYVVYPRVEDAEPNVKAVTREFENLKRALAPFTVGLLHGRLRSKEKEAVMEAFRTGAMPVLLATSLIEVGVDVPNATILVIENAELFGLAQLHQLRGRIGRGAAEAYCILISNADHAEARQRFKVLEETTDGFRIAEADLKLRGPGELLGRQQSGMPKFRFGDLVEDWELVRLAQQLTARTER